jgi:hypothetical protein
MIFFARALRDTVFQSVSPAKKKRLQTGGGILMEAVFTVGAQCGSQYPL